MSENRLILIKETGEEFREIERFMINRGVGSAGEDFQITFPKINPGYEPGDPITFKGLPGLVTQVEFQANPGGYFATVSGVSSVADLIRKAPGKAIMYMSMTPDEIEEFYIANDGDFSDLDYIPKIKECSPETFTGGWRVKDVMSELAINMGIGLTCNVRNFWIRQVQCDVQSSFFDTIMSLVSFLKPIVYISDGVLYILNKPLRGGAVELTDITVINQKQTFNYNSMVTYLKISGGLGKWNRAMYKGKCDPEIDEQITCEMGSETGLQMYWRYHGDLGMVSRLLGTNSSDLTLARLTANTLTDTTTTIESYRLDPFGNPKAMLTRYISTHNAIVDGITFQSNETFEYEFLEEKYDKPRLLKKIATVSRYSWCVTTMAGQGIWRHFKGKTDVITEEWFYAPNGTLLEETMTRETDCMVFINTGWAGAANTYVEMDVSDMLWWEDHWFERVVVEEKIVSYRQLTPTTYQRATYHRKLGNVQRALGDGRHTLNVEMLRGRVPKHPKSYRKMQVYAEMIPDETAIMEVPALIISNPNIIDWEDAEALLADVKKEFVDVKSYLDRQLVIPKELDVDIGWPISLGAGVKIGNDGYLPTPTMSECYIASWQRMKDAPGAMASTNIVVRGNVI